MPFLELAAFACLAMAIAEIVTAACIARQELCEPVNLVYLLQVERPILPPPVPIDFISNRCGGVMDGPCAICLEDPGASKQVRITVCGHTFCAECFEAWYAKVQRCPLCNTEFQN
jgi:hypothetical protein